MNTWKSKRLNRWKQTRKKGRGHYVLKTTLIATGSVLFGKTVGFILFDKVRTCGVFQVSCHHLLRY